MTEIFLIGMLTLAVLAWALASPPPPRIKEIPIVRIRDKCAGCGCPLPFRIEDLSVSDEEPTWLAARRELLAAGWGVNDDDMSGMCPACMAADPEGGRDDQIQDEKP
jgi:hypothetical protein